MIYYKTLTFGKLIEEVNISKKTDKSIWIIDKNGNEVMTRKESNYANYFETKLEAKKYLEDIFNSKIIGLAGSIDLLRKKIKELDSY